MEMTPSQPKIDCRIAFEPGGKLGQDYNRIFRETAHEWVLIPDHDILLATNPHWYTICQHAIRDNPRAGIFTCWTNNIGNAEQRWDDGAAVGDSITEHKRIARDLFDRCGFGTSRIEGARCSGMLLLIRVEAWKRAGGFPGVGMFREDWTFGRKVQAAGFEVRRMDGLYVYHVRDRDDGSWLPGEETSKEIRDRLGRKGK